MAKKGNATKNNDRIDKSESGKNTESKVLKSIDNKMTTLIVAITIIVVLLIGVLVAVMMTNHSSEYKYEDDNFEYRRVGDLVEVTRFKNASSVKQVTIPDKIEGFVVNGIGDNVFKDNAVIEEIILEPNIKTIGKGAFMNATKLKSVVMRGVTSIGDDAFNGCENLGQINMPETLKTIGNRAFKDCSHLYDFQYKFDKDFVVKSVLESVGEDAFNGSRLSTLPIPSSMNNIGRRAFANAKLSKVIFYNGVKSIGEEAFLHSDNGTSINLYTYNKEKVAKFVSEDNTIELSKLYEVSDQNVLPETLEVIEARAFKKTDTSYGRLYLSTIAFPKNLKSIGDEAFYGTSMSDISFQNPNTTLGKYAFSRLSSTIHNLKLPANLKVIEEGLFLGTTISGNRKLEIPASVETIGIGAFSGLQESLVIEFAKDSPADKKYSYVNGNGYRALTSKDGKILYSMLLDSGETVINIPATVEIIEKYAFVNVGRRINAINDIRITVHQNVKEIKEGAFAEAYVLNYYFIHGDEDVLNISAKAFASDNSKSEYVLRAVKGSKVLTNLENTFKDVKGVTVTTTAE